MAKQRDSAPVAPSEPLDPFPSAETLDGRILRTAADQLFTFGYASLTMDDLAHELGMSKKTLYVYFPGKEAIANAIIEHVTRKLKARLDVITSDPQLNFVQKLAAMVETISSMLSRASPTMLRDLQRFAPEAYAKIEATRAENVPKYFGRLIRDGIAQKRVKPDIDPDFAAQFWLQAMRGLIQPAVLDKTHLSPRQTLEKAIHLFFGGLLTPAGHTDYENLRASRHSPRGSV